MLATCVLAGRITELPVPASDAPGNTEYWMSVETDRPFRNPDGVLPKNTFRVKLWRGIAEETAAACRKGSFAVIRGRLQADEGSANNPEIIAEKVSFVSEA